MKKSFLVSLFFLYILFFDFSSKAFALVELRAHYGFSKPSQNISELCSACSNSSVVPGMPSNNGIGADLIVSLPAPLERIGIGARYENSGFSSLSQGLETRASHIRTAVLVNYRLINQLIFFGPIATYGLSHSGSFDITENTVKLYEYAADQARSYSIGAEAGFRLIAFTITAEAGYLDERWQDAKNSVSSGLTKDINFSGTYAKIHLGFAY